MFFRVFNYFLSAPVVYLFKKLKVVIIRVYKKSSLNLKGKITMKNIV
ncbi:PTS sugar transporter subunit IIB, partial [Listeria monocytogenes]|nr:PTS sugar transporter subunit IIB [Listeria monocytogenes]